jgi:hypothetical protein
MEVAEADDRKKERRKRRGKASQLATQMTKRPLYRLARTRIVHSRRLESSWMGALDKIHLVTQITFLRSLTDIMIDAYGTLIQ